MTQINCVNTNVSNAGAAVVQVFSTQSSGALMASDVFQLRTAGDVVDLFPGANSAQSPALRALGSGDVQVSGALSQGGLVAFHARKSNGNSYGTLGAITFNVVDLNTGGAFDGTTFTAPRAGHYHFYAHGFAQVDRTRIRITRGGAYLADGWGLVGGYNLTPTATALLRGLDYSNSSRAWLGIPYASPPTGDARFRPPAAAQPGELEERLERLPHLCDERVRVDVEHVRVASPERASTCEHCSLWLGRPDDAVPFT